MRVTVLGKYGPYPKEGGATSGYLLTDGYAQVLLDCGSGILSRLQRYLRPEKLSAVVLSHFHPDHTADMPLLKYYFDTNYSPHILSLYAPAGLDPSLLANKRFEYTCFQDKACFNVGALQFQVHKASHVGEAYFFSVLCEGKKFIYTGDSRICANLLKECETADIILADAGTEAALRSQNALHMSPAEAGELAALNHAYLLLTHIHPNHSEQKQLADAAAFAKHVTVAQELTDYDF